MAATVRQLAELYSQMGLSMARQKRAWEDGDVKTINREQNRLSRLKRIERRMTPFKCGRCEERFVSPEELKAHRNEAHPPHREPWDPAPYCGKLINPMSERAVNTQESKSNE